MIELATAKDMPVCLCRAVIVADGHVSPGFPVNIVEFQRRPDEPTCLEDLARHGGLVVPLPACEPHREGLREPGVDPFLQSQLWLSGMVLVWAWRFGELAAQS